MRGAVAPYGLAAVLILAGIGIASARAHDYGEAAPVQQEQCQVEYDMAAFPSWTDYFAWLAKKTGKPVFTAFKMQGAPWRVHLPADLHCSLPELLERINDGMAHQGFRLGERSRTFGIEPIDEPPFVEVADLNKRGNTEIVQTILTLVTLDAVEIAPDVKRMLSPQAVVVPFKVSNRLLLQDKVSNLKAVAWMIRENDEPVGNETISHVCKVIRASEGERILRELLVGSLRANISVDEDKNMVLVKGSHSTMAMAKDVLRMLDVAGPRQVLSPWPMLRQYELPAAKAQGIVERLRKEYRESKNVGISLAGETTILIFAREADQIEIAKRIEKDPTKLRPDWPGSK
jgi:hypothetical protein